MCVHSRLAVLSLKWPQGILSAWVWGPAKVPVLEWKRCFQSIALLHSVIWQTFGKYFLHPAGYGSVFPPRSCWGIWRSDGWWAKSQGIMVDEVKIHSPIYSTFEVLVVWYAVRCYCGEKLGFLLASAGCKCCSFWCMLLIFSGFRKL